MSPRLSGAQRSKGLAPHADAPLPSLRAGRRVILIAHPLWDTRQPAGLLSTAIEALGTDGHQFGGCVDTFNLIRRPGWAYQQLAGG